jgi:hypothetical protein
LHEVQSVSNLETLRLMVCEIVSTTSENGRAEGKARNGSNRRLELELCAWRGVPTSALAQPSVPVGVLDEIQPFLLLRADPLRF